MSIPEQSLDYGIFMPDLVVLASDLSKSLVDLDDMPHVEEVANTCKVMEDSKNILYPLSTEQKQERRPVPEFDSGREMAGLWRQGFGPKTIVGLGKGYSMLGFPGAGLMPTGLVSCDADVYWPAWLADMIWNASRLGHAGTLIGSFPEVCGGLKGGFLDGQFSQLQQLQDESNPQFVMEVVTLFFEDSERLLNDLSTVLDQPIVDFKNVDAHVHQLKGSSSSIGAHRVTNVCIPFRNSCEEQNIQGCLRCLQLVKQEYFLVKNKLETLFRLEQQIVAAGGVIPIVE